MTASIDLSGLWDFSLGETPRYSSQLRLPGSLQTQGFGNDVSVETAWTGEIVDRSWFTEEKWAPYRQPGNVKIPFWLQPEKHYVGPAWYRREIEIPRDWAGRRVILFLERAHIQTMVYLDGVLIGSQHSLAAPHIHDLGCDLRSGRHELAICVDNRPPVDIGPNSSSLTDHTQTNWNGIIGRIEIKALPAVWIEQADVFPDPSGVSVLLRIAIRTATGRPGRDTLYVGDQPHEVGWDAGGGVAEIVVPIPEKAEHWNEFTPCLQRLSISFGEDDTEVVFGIRHLGTSGTQIVLNGRPIFLRGTLECCVFPRTGYPPMTIEEWRPIFGTIKDHGFNLVRFHSWCPPEAAFCAADEMGLYLQVECSTWPNTTTGLGRGLPVDTWLYEEAAAILRTYGNHPSFLFLAAGNEPGKALPEFSEYLAGWVRHWKARDPRRLYTSAAGWPALPENDYHNIPEPRIQAWGEGLGSRINAQPPSTMADYRRFIDEPEGIVFDPGGFNTAAAQAVRPIITHEAGQWCAYPDFSEIGQYTGLLKARNFEIFRDTLEANHMGRQAADFLNASGRLQVLCYKEEIESFLRTRNFGGFHLLQANDFPGQGTALVGWLNPFWKSKGYVTAAEFRRFNHATVVLARLERLTFTCEETLRASLEVAHFGAGPLEGARPYWRLVDQAGREYARGEFAERTLPIGNGILLGTIHLPLAALPAPRQYKLIAGLGGTEFENDWDIWVYPPPIAETVAGEEVLFVRDWDDLTARIRPGAKILFNPPADRVSGDVALGFSSIFWNTLWTRGQAPHTLGVLCDPSHPAFAEFPTQAHSNWQWWDLVHDGAAMILDALPPSVCPLVQVIDDWFTNRRLALAFEVSVDGCDILVCSSDITSDLAHRHAARQFRSSLLGYMEGGSFHPRTAVALEQIAELFRR